MYKGANNLRSHDAAYTVLYCTTTRNICTAGTVCQSYGKEILFSAYIGQIGYPTT